MPVLDDLHAVLYEGTPLRRFLDERARLVATSGPDFSLFSVDGLRKQDEIRRAILRSQRGGAPRSNVFDRIDPTAKFDAIIERCRSVPEEVERRPRLRGELLAMLEQRIGKRPGFRSKASLLLALTARVLDRTERWVRQACGGDLRDALEKCHPARTLPSIGPHPRRAPLSFHK